MGLRGSKKRFAPGLHEIKLTVLLSISPPDGTTRFVNQLVEPASRNIDYKFFTWKTAYFSKYDVFHVHWPEQLYRSNGKKSWKACVLFVGLLLRCKLFRTPLVRTLHNIAPHDGVAKLDKVLLALCDLATSLYIRLNTLSDLRGKPGVTIRHGHYKGRYKVRPEARAVRGRILYFGIIREYKGVPDLLDAFTKIDDVEASLRIIGHAKRDFGNVIEKISERDNRISSVLHFVSDNVLAEEVISSELVVLPYREMHNSGAILVALSLNRPVLVPNTETNRLLAGEVGDGWIFTFDGKLTSDLLVTTLRAVRALDRSSTPALDNRDWSLIGDAHYRAYKSLFEGAAIVCSGAD